MEKASGPPIEVLQAKTEVALMFLDARQPTLAREILAPALAALRLQPITESLGDAAFALARAMWATGAWDEALVLASEALAAYERTGDGSGTREERDAVARWLAKHGTVQPARALASGAAVD